MFFSAASFSLGFASGFGTGFFTREVSHISVVTLRPMVKGLIKSSLMVVDRSREAVARAGEHFEDLVAEVRTELTDAHMAEAQSDLAGAGAVSSPGANYVAPAEGGRERSSDKTIGNGSSAEGHSGGEARAAAGG